MLIFSCWFPVADFELLIFSGCFVVSDWRRPRREGGGPLRLQNAATFTILHRRSLWTRYAVVRTLGRKARLAVMPGWDPPGPSPGAFKFKPCPPNCHFESIITKQQLEISDWTSATKDQQLKSATKNQQPIISKQKSAPENEHLKMSNWKSADFEVLICSRWFWFVIFSCWFLVADF